MIQSWEHDADAIAKLDLRLASTVRYQDWKNGQFVDTIKTSFDTRMTQRGYAGQSRTERSENGVLAPNTIRGVLLNDYYFAAITSKGDTDWRLDLVELSKAAEGKTPGGHWAPQNTDSRLPWLSQQDGSLSIYRIALDPRFRFTQVEPTQGGRKFHFKFDAAAQPPPETHSLSQNVLSLHTTVRAGWFEVSGTNNRLTAYDLERSTPPKFKPYHEIGAISYHEPSRLPVSYAKKLEVETPAYEKRDGTIVRLRLVKEFEVEYPASGSDREFYLSHYGLPEPPGITPPSRPMPTYVWLLIAAGGFGVITLACRWLLKRRAKAVPPIPPAAA